MGSSRPRGRCGGVPLEVLAVWALFAAVCVEILVTYWRLPAAELYHVSGSGLTGGLSRVLVFLNFPLALVAIPILAVLAERLATRATTVLALVGIGLSTAIFWPGIVTQSDLDARWVNVVPALGVLVAVALTVFTWRKLGRERSSGRQPGDVLRVLLALAALALAVPWLGADLGVSFNGVPVLGTLYQSGELRTQPLHLSRGELVDVKTSAAPGIACSGSATVVTRIIGLPGETVEIRLIQGAGYVFVDGRKLDEPYVQRRDAGPARTYRVPSAKYFVLSDDRSRSCDSRVWGSVPGKTLAPTTHPAVHHGHHHGMDGVLLVLSALLLSRVLPSIARGWLQIVVWALLALMFCYGAMNLANDFWLEQVVKRGWTTWEIPDVTTPKVSVAWLVIVVAAAALWGITLWYARRSPRSSAPPKLEAA